MFFSNNEPVFLSSTAAHANSGEIPYFMLGQTGKENVCVCVCVCVCVSVGVSVFVSQRLSEMMSFQP